MGHRHRMHSSITFWICNFIRTRFLPSFTFTTDSFRPIHPFSMESRCIAMYCVWVSFLLVLSSLVLSSFFVLSARSIMHRLHYSFHWIGYKIGFIQNESAIKILLPLSIAHAYTEYAQYSNNNICNVWIWSLSGFPAQQVHSNLFSLYNVNCCLYRWASERTIEWSLCTRILSFSMSIHCMIRTELNCVHLNVQSVTQCCINNGLMFSIVQTSCQFFLVTFFSSFISLTHKLYLIYSVFSFLLREFSWLTHTPLHSLSSHSIIVRSFRHRRSCCFSPTFIAVCALSVNIRYS